MDIRQIKSIQPKKEQEVVATLTYQGKIAAIRLYMKYAECRLQEAKSAVEKLSAEIEPGQAAS